MKKRQFTLIEMLTVIAIISILASLVIPVVIISQRKGQETQAKSDIASLVSALKELDAKESKMLLKSGTNYKIGGKDVSVTDKIATIGGADQEDAYNAMIAELSVPKGKNVTVNVNRHKRKYLEVKKGFDVGKNYDDEDNKKALWRDPWENPYVIYIKVSGDDELELPGCADDKTIAANVAVYSYGPNGEDDKGCHFDLLKCIKAGEDANHKQHDDIASWNL